MASDKTLMVTISGIRGIFGRGLDASVLVRFTGAYGTWIRHRALAAGRVPAVVLGRDARVTGELCARLVAGTLQSVGVNVIDTGLATTPTVEMAVKLAGASGGIILSASHNPAEWNALKLLNETGEFLSPAQAAEVIALSEQGVADTVSYEEIGTLTTQDFLPAHIEAILALPFLNVERIAARNFRVVVDAVNSVGSIALPPLLKALGVNEVEVLNPEPTGRFAHNPEPLPENLTQITAAVAESGADFGIVVDPDVDRLAFVEDGGTYMSEELTQVAAADFLWRHRSGPFVTNLSSSRAIEDVAKRHGQEAYRSAVGEINVVGRMHEVGAILGGEGNGGVILPDLHHGRDALIGVAMVLQHLADTGLSLSALRATLPAYAISKNKLEIAGLDAKSLLARLAERYAGGRVSTIDGVKVDLDEGWVHVRASNTEPILRIYAEAATSEEADALAARFKRELLEG